MKQSGGHIEEGREIRSQLMSWFESTKPFLSFFFYIKRGFLSLHQLSLPLEIKVEIKKRGREQERPNVCGLVLLECV